MRINIVGKNLDLTPSIKTYAEEKLLPLSRFLKKIEEEGEVLLWLELARVTEHHRKDHVFMASADLKLPGKILHAECDSSDARAAIDGVKDELRSEIGKYRTRILEPKRTQSG